MMKIMASLEKTSLQKNQPYGGLINVQRKPCVTDINLIFLDYVKSLILLSRRFIQPLYFSKTAYE